jgi:hypothetical protein
VLVLLLVIDEHGTSLTGLVRFFPAMKTTTKAALLFLCFLLCAAGAVLSTKETPEADRDSHTQVLPVNNHQRYRGIWLRV